MVNDEIEVTEEQIQAFYDGNPTLYQLPESADIRYIRISRDDVAANVDVSEEELAAYYEDNKSRYLQDEQRRARHILILSGDDPDAAEAEALAILERIRAGESFEALAAELSADTLTAAQGGDFGPLTRAQYPTELASEIFSMSTSLDGLGINRGDHFLDLLIGQLESERVPVVKADRQFPNSFITSQPDIFQNIGDNFLHPDVRGMGLLSADAMFQYFCHGFPPEMAF